MPFLFSILIFPNFLGIVEKNIDTISVRIVQPNIKQEDKWNKEKLIQLGSHIGFDVPINLERKNTFLTGKSNEMLRFNKKFKLRRGFQAKSHTSLHRWYDKKMDGIIRNWLPQINKIILQEIEATNNQK